MNGHQTYVANMLNKTTPAAIAAGVAKPPGNRSSEKGVPFIHECVLKYAMEIDELVDQWVALLAAAAGVEPGEDWPPLWMTGLGDMLAQLPVRAEAQVTELHQAA